LFSGIGPLTDSALRFTQNYSVSTDTGDENYYYLIGPDGIIASGEDVDELFLLAGKRYREKR
jgi:hypothetical protein